MKRLGNDTLARGSGSSQSASPSGGCAGTVPTWTLTPTQLFVKLPTR